MDFGVVAFAVRSLAREMEALRFNPKCTMCIRELLRIRKQRLLIINGGLCVLAWILGISAWVALGFSDQRLILFHFFFCGLFAVYFFVVIL